MDKLNEDDLFVIDSNNINGAEKRLYGSAYYNQKFIGNDDIDDNNIELSGVGSYINVYETSDSIVIEQDFMGSWGLYVYNSPDGQNYAISNSFVKLVDYLKGKYEISLNKRIADSLIFCGSNSIAYDETLINEIELLPRFYKVVINKDDNRLGYEKINYEENSIDLDSKEGVELLDKWYNKWINIIRLLRNRTNTIDFDLSGGMDTRAVAALWLTANINLENIDVHSMISENKVHIEDYEIASQIAEEFGFKINNGNNYQTPIKDYRISLVNSFNISLGSYNRDKFRDAYYDGETLYAFTGMCGATVRIHPNPPKAKYINNLLKKINENDFSLADSTYDVIESAINRIAKDYCISPDAENIMHMHYKETRNRYHFGRHVVETLFVNRTALIPLMDPDLHKLKRTTGKCGDNNLLNIFIMSRYCPKLLDFKIEGNRKFNEGTVEYAKKVNEKFPFKRSELEFVDGPKPVKKHVINDFKGIKATSKINDFLSSVFDSDKFEEQFVKHFSSRSYYSIQRMKTEDYQNYLRTVFCAVSCLRIIRDVEGNFEFDNDLEWLESFLGDENESAMNKDVKGLLTPFATARIDMKNRGNESNNLEIINASDRYASIFSNSFKTSDGSGAIIESYKGSMDFDIRCVNDGKLNIYLRGKDMRDLNKEKFPVYIDYSSFKINGEEQLPTNKVVSSEIRHSISLEVSDGEIIHIHMEWKPFNRKSVYENTLQKKLDILEGKNEKANIDLNRTKKELSDKEMEIREIKRELEETQNELDRLQNSKNLISRFKGKL